MAPIGEVGTGTQPPFEAVVEAAQGKPEAAAGAQQNAVEDAEAEPTEALTEGEDEGGQGESEPGHDSDTLATLRQYHVPKSVLERLTPAEADRMAFKFLRAEARRRGGQEGQPGSKESSSSDPAAPRESTAERATGLSDAALSEALSGLTSLEKDQGIEGLSAAFGKPLGLIAQHVNQTLGTYAKENASLKDALTQQGGILQTLLTDRAVSAQLGKHPELSEGSVRSRFVKQLQKQLKAEDGLGLEGLDAAAARAALIELGGKGSAKPKSNDTDKRLRSQPSASATRTKANPRDTNGQFLGNMSEADLEAKIRERFGIRS